MSSLSPALQLGAAAFVIGLTGAMAPGPLLTVAITEACKRGWRAIALMAGHALLEAALLVGFAFGLQRVLVLPTVSRGLALVGGAFLVWMGGSLLLGAVRGKLTLPAEEEAPADGSPQTIRSPGRLRHGPFVTGALVSISNPYWTIWWATIGVTLAAKGLEIGAVGVAAFFIGHELADLTWYGSVIGAVASGRHLLSHRVYRAVIGTCAALLVVLGAGFVLSGLRGLG